jgi:hypothetical protein
MRIGRTWRTAAAVAFAAGTLWTAPGCGDSGTDGGQIQVGNARDPERLKKMADYMNNRPGMKPAGKKAADKAPAPAPDQAPAPDEAAPKS